jgi:carbonic anhydrase
LRALQLRPYPSSADSLRCGPPQPLLRNIRDVYRIHEKDLDKIMDEDQKYRRLVELNVLEQGRNFIKTAIVEKSYHEHAYPIVHAWV